MTTPEPAPIGIGCMRLGADDGTEVLSAAIAAGARLLDTADVYHADGGSIGDNERQVAAAVAKFAGDRDELVIATKGGMTRRGARWIPDGRARHIKAACEASLDRLGRIDLYLLHAPDPKVSLATSARALMDLKARGLVGGIGVCNVRRDQLAEVLALTDLDAISVALNPIDITAVRGGVIAAALERGIRVLAHSPLGGPRRISRVRRHRQLRDLAAAAELATEDLALAWCADLDRLITPIPGVSRTETALAAVGAQRIALGQAQRLELDDALQAGSLLRTSMGERRPAKGDGDVVVLMGTPGAGKSTVARRYVEEGYHRLNRDKRGGTLAGLLPALAESLAAGQRRVVLDNTYASRAARNQVIETAWQGGALARCVHLDTSIEDAQINAVTRMVRAGGALPSPEEIKKLARKTPNVFAPSVLFNYRRALERPTLEEGFESVETLEFVRDVPASRTARALLLEIDGVLRRTRSGADRPQAPDDVELLQGRGALLRRHQRDGWLLLGVSWQPEVGSGAITTERAEACFDRTRELLGLDFDIAFCPHIAGPPKCWCRKPLPGLGVAFIEKHKLDPSASLMVGRNPTDRLFADRLGFPYRDADAFFDAAADF